MEVTRTYDLALDTLYEVFSRYPFRRNMPCCIPHCLDQADLDIMGAMPLRALSATLMQPFASNLNTTCGERDDFKFVLPRLLELSCDFEFIWPSCDLVFSWLRTEELNTWPADEQHAVIGFLDSWWERELRKNSDRVFDCFDALTCSGVNVTRWMTRWRELAPISLADWIAHNIAIIWSGKHSNAFADDRPLVAQIKAFLEDPETAAALERAFHKTNDAAEQDTLSLAEHYLRM
jgi:hypothetical protein